MAVKRLARWGATGSLAVFFGLAGMTLPAEDAAAQLSKQQFCSAVGLSTAACALVASVQDDADHSWEAATGAETLSGSALQSAESIQDDDEAMFTVRLSPGVVGLEFHRRVSSEVDFSWLTFEYNDNSRDIRSQFSALEYRSLPFFNDAGVRVQGDISGTSGSYKHGDDTVAAVSLGSNNEWSLLRLLPVAGDITELRWIYHKGGLNPTGADRGWIDGLRLYPAVSTATLCAALDFETDNCTVVQSPSTRSWVVDDGVTPAVSSAALRAPLRVLSGEKTCLSLTTPVAAGQMLGFFWRLDVATNTALTFEVDDMAVQTLAGTGRDSGWVAVSWTATAAVSRLTWCYQGYEVGRAWVDTLSIGAAPRPLTGAVVTDAVLEMTANERRQLTYRLDFVVAQDIVGASGIGLTAASGVSNVTVTAMGGVTVEDAAEGRLSAMLRVDLPAARLVGSVPLNLTLTGLPNPTEVEVSYDLEGAGIPRLCAVLEMSEADCALVASVENDADHPWEVVTFVASFARGSQSDPNLNDSEASSLKVTLSPGVAAVEFEWRIDSEMCCDVLSFFYNGNNQPPGSLFDDAGEPESIFEASGVQPWSLLRVSPTAGDVTELQWTYSKNGDTSSLVDSAFIAGLRLYPAVSTATLCAALDFETDNCTVVQSPSTRSWVVDDGVTPAPTGGSALRMPLRVPASEKACLSPSLPVAAGETVEFSWRLDAARGSALTLEADDVVVQTLAGNGSDSGWIVASWTAPATVDSFAWCYAGAEFSRAWVDALSVGTLPGRLAGSMLEMTANGGRELTYRLDFVVSQDLTGASGIGLTAVSGVSNVTVTVMGEVTVEDAAEGRLSAMLQLELPVSPPLTTVPLTLTLTGLPDPTEVEVRHHLGGVGIPRLCAILGMGDADCDLITGMSLTGGSWFYSSSDPLGGAGRNLRAPQGVGDDSMACLILDVSLPAGARVDFQWRINTEQGSDYIGFYVDGQRLTRGSAFIDWNLQQRFVAEAATELRWCYERDGSGGDAAVHTMRLDQLSFSLSAAEAQLLDKDDLCATLDLSVPHCTAVQSFEQTPPMLSWVRNNSSFSVRGDNRLQIPSTVMDNESSCLELAVDIVTDSRVQFSWRLAAATGSELTFVVDGTVVETLAGDGSVSAWTEVSWTAPAAAGSLGWCYTDSATGSEFANRRIAWLDELSLQAPLTIVSVSTPVLAENQANGRQPAYTFDVTVEATSSSLAVDQFNLAGIGLSAAGENMSLVTGLTLGEVTAIGGGLSYPATVKLDLGANQLIGSDALALQLQLTGVPTTPSQGFALALDIFEPVLTRLCSVLGVGAGDCEMITGVSVSENLPWLISNTSPLSGAGANLRSPQGVPDNGSACLTIAVSLPAMSRVDFQWRYDTQRESDYFTFYFGNTLAARGTANVGWNQQQRFTTAAVTELRWCFERDEAGGLTNVHHGRLELLRFITAADEEEAELLPDTATLCSALDLGADCVSGFGHNTVVAEVTATPGPLSWTVTDEESVSGGSALRNPLTVLDGETSCLNLTVALAAGDLVLFSWRLHAVNLSELAFLVNGTEELKLAGDGNDSNWREVLWTATEAVSSLSWCYEDSTPPSGGEEAPQRRAWLDALTFGRLASILSVSDPVMTAADGRRLTYTFDATIQAVEGSLEAGPYGLRASGDDAPLVVAGTGLTVAAPVAVAEGLSLSATLVLDLDNNNRLGDTQANLQLHITGLASTPSQGVALVVDISAGNVPKLCLVLGLSDTDCALVTAVRVSGESAWLVSGSTALDGAGNNLRSPLGVADSSTACITIDVSLPAGSRIDFQWRIQTEASSDYFNFYLGEERIVRGSDLIDWHPQQRFAEMPVDALRWCFERDAAGGDAGVHSGRIDQLRFIAADEAPLLEQNALCEALDLVRLSPDFSCGAVQSFQQTPPVLSWVAEETPFALRGADRLRIPLTVLDNERSCLKLAVNLAAGDVIQFSWRLAAATGSDLSFEVDDAVEQTLAGDGSVSDWTAVSWTADSTATSFAWCYTDSAAGNEDGDLRRAWVDDLIFGPLVAIVSVSTPQLTDSRDDLLFTYRFEATVAVPNGSLSAGQYDLGLTAIGVNANLVQRVAVVRQVPADDGVVLVANLQLRFTGLLRSLPLQLGLTGVPTSTMQQAFDLTLDTSDQIVERLCSVLGMSAENCEQVTAVTFSDAELPWIVSGTSALGGADNNLRSPVGLPDDSSSCLTVDVSLPAGSRIDFYWRIATEEGSDYIGFYIDDERSMRQSGSVGWHLQQRFVGDAVSSLGWCFKRDASGGDAATHHGRLDSLRFIAPTEEGVQLLDKNALCSALDLGAFNCAAITDFEQTPSALSWRVDESADSERGGSRLQIPATVLDNEDSCLALTAPLAAGDTVQFSWRLAAAVDSDLTFVVDGMVEQTLTGNGNDSDWAQVTWEAAAAAGSFGWCYADSATGGEEPNRRTAFVDALAFGARQLSITAVSTPTLVQNQAVYRLQVTVEADSGVLRPDDYDIGIAVTGDNVIGTPEPVVLRQVQAEDGVGLLLEATLNPNLARLVDALQLQLRLVGVLTPDSGFDVTLDVTDFWLPTLCSVLEMSADDCRMLTAVSTTGGDWFLSASEALTLADTLNLRSPQGVPDSTSACVTFEVSLPAMSRVDFWWRISTEEGGDYFGFYINDERITRQSGFVDWHRQQRFAEMQVNSLSWCYERDDMGGDSNAHSGRLDELRFTAPAEAPLLDKDAVCSALDLGAVTCAAITGFEQTPAGLSWRVDESESDSVRGGSRLQTPAALLDHERSCFKLTTPLAVGDIIQFSWRLAAADGSALTFEVDDNLVQTLAGTGDDLDWMEFRWTAESAATSLGWCYADSATGSEFAFRRMAFVDALIIAPTLLTIRSVSTPTLVAEGGGGQLLSYEFEVEVAAPDGTALTPGEQDIGLRMSGRFVNEITMLTVSEQAAADGGGLLLSAEMQLNWVSMLPMVSWRLHLANVPTHGDDGVAVELSVSAARVRTVFCLAVDLRAEDCSLVESISTTARYPWQAGAMRLQSDPESVDNTDSVLIVELSEMLDGVIFEFGINAETNELMIFEVNDLFWGDAGHLQLPIMDGSGASRSGGIGGGTGDYSYTLHLLPSDNTPPLSRLRWIYRKNASASGGLDLGFIDQMRFQRQRFLESVMTVEQLCEALDANDRACETLQLSPQTPAESPRPWFIGSSFYRGNSALQLADVAREESPICFNLAVDIEANQTIGFFWRLDAVTDSNLAFLVNGETQLTLRSGEGDSGWLGASWIAAEAVTSIAWCYASGVSVPGGGHIEEAWVDALTIGSQVRIANITDPTLMQGNDQRPTYDFDVVLEAVSGTLVPGENELGLTVAIELTAEGQQNEITLTSMTVGVQQAAGDGVSLPVALQLDVKNILLSQVPLRLQVVGLPSTPQNGVVFALDTSELLRFRLCELMEVDGEDCDLIQRVTISDDLPWLIGSFNPFSGENLRSPQGVQDGESACMTLDVSLPMASRVDFQWRIETEANSDYFAFYINGERVARQSGEVEWHLLQRFSAEAVTSIGWCYERDASGGIAIAHHGRLDALSFSTGAAASLLPNNAALCAALDLDTADCDAVSAFSQEPPALLWSVTMDTFQAGDSALQIPATVLDNESSCLNLTVAVGVGYSIGFWWRQNVAGGSGLAFSVNGTPVQELSVVGSDSTWLEVTLDLDEAATSIGWCYADSESTGEESDQRRAWVDNLGFTAPELEINIAAATTPVLTGTSADGRRGSYSFEVRVNAPFFTLTPGEHQIGLRATGDDAALVTNLAVAPAQTSVDGGLMLSATFELDLSPLYKTIDGLRLGLSGAATGPRLIPLASIDISVETLSLICAALDLESADCDLLDGFETSAAAPWRVTTATFQNGDHLLGSGADIADNAESCLTLELASGSELPAGSRVDFQWRFSTEAGEDSFFFFLLNPNSDIAESAVRGSGDEWHRQQRFTAGVVDRLRWCYNKGASGAAGDDRGWVDGLNLLQPSEAALLPNKAALCRALDLDPADCGLISAFSQRPPALSWSVTMATFQAGDSALQIPTTVLDREFSCLNLTVAVTAGYSINFWWRLNAASGSDLAFSVNGTPVEGLELSGAGSDSTWREVTLALEEDATSISWCYQDQESAGEGSNQRQAWVDALDFIAPELEINIVSATTPVLTGTSADGRRLSYSLEVRVNAQFSALTPGEHQIRLQTSGTAAASVMNLAVAPTQVAVEDGLMLSASFDLDLSPLRNTIDDLRLGLSGDAVGSRLVTLPPIDVSAETLALICVALDLEQADCDLLGGFSTTESAPWQLATAAFQNGDSLLGSGSGVADDGESCLTLEFAAGSELPVAARMDFLWAVDAATGDGLQLQINGTEIASFGGLGASVITPHRQQRFATAAVSSVTWCYTKDASGTGGADRGWVDDLQLLQPLDATLLPATTTAVCTVLDITAEDCSVISALSQSPDTLNWDTDSAVHRAGGNSLRTPQTTTDGEMACLTLALEPTLPAGTEVAFRWRVDSAAGSALELYFNDTALTPPVSISGLASAVTSNNGWRTQTGEAAAELTSLGWCYSRVAGMFAGTEQGWVEQLQLNPPFAFPVFSLESTVNRLANNGIELTLRLRPGAGEAALPEGVVVLVRPDNLENVMLTTLTASATAIDYQVTATVSDTNDIARLRFTVGSLPPAVEPLPGSAEFAVTIESQTSVDAAMLLRALSVEPSSAPPGISLNDLLLGLRLTTGEEVTPLLTNLGADNNDRTAQMRSFTEFLANPEQSVAVDINGDETVNTLDFRLMVRYLSGLRGEELLCNSLCEARLNSLFRQ